MPALPSDEIEFFLIGVRIRKALIRVSVRPVRDITAWQVRATICKLPK